MLYPGDVPGSAVDFNLGFVGMIPDINVTSVVLGFFSHRLAGLTGSHSEGT